LAGTGRKSKKMAIRGDGKSRQKTWTGGRRKSVSSPSSEIKPERRFALEGKRGQDSYDAQVPEDLF